MKLRKLLVLMAIPLSVGVGACDLFDGLTDPVTGQQQTGTIDTTAAAGQSVTAALEITGAVDDPTSEAPLGAINRLQSNLSLLQQSGAIEASKSGALTTAEFGLSPDCVVLAGNMVTYTDCAVQGVTYSGTVNVTGDNATFDITIVADPSKFAPPGAAGQQSFIKINSVTIHEIGDLTFTPTSLDGTVALEFTTNQTLTLPGIAPETSDTTTTSNVVYDLTLLDGCGVGGTLTIVSSNTTTTATYGPACGDVDVTSTKN